NVLFDGRRTYMYGADRTIAEGERPVAATTATIQQLGAVDGRFNRRMWGTLIVLCGALFLDALDVSMIGVALPSIKADLGMSTSSLQWVVRAYVLRFRVITCAVRP